MLLKWYKALKSISAQYMFHPYNLASEPTRANFI